MCASPLSLSGGKWRYAKERARRASWPVPFFASLFSAQFQGSAILAPIRARTDLPDSVRLPRAVCDGMQSAASHCNPSRSTLKRGKATHCIVRAQWQPICWNLAERLVHSSTGLFSTFGILFSTFYYFLVPHLELGSESPWTESSTHSSARKKRKLFFAACSPADLAP